MTDILTNPIISDPETSHEDPIESHIVGPLYTDEGKISGSTRLTEAMVTGNAVEALCGYLWVPSRDPKKYPLCKVCESIANGASRFDRHDL